MSTRPADLKSKCSYLLGTRMQLACAEDAHLDVAVCGVAQVFVLTEHDLEDVVETSELLVHGRIVGFVDLVFHPGLTTAQWGPATDVKE